MSFKKFQNFSVVDELTVSDVARLLKDDWLECESVSNLKDIIDFAAEEYGFDVNSVERGETVLDTICSDEEQDGKLSIVTSLVEAGAKPELARNDVIVHCIEPYAFVSHDAGMHGSVTDHVTSLLKHGAKLNEVQRTESGVKLTSPCLQYLLTTCGRFRAFMEVAILLLVHGACVDPQDMTSVLLDQTTAAPLVWVVDSRVMPVDGAWESVEECLRLWRYFRCAGLTSRNARLRNIDHQQLVKLLMSMWDAQPLKVLKYMRGYLRSLEPRPESLQFQCRRVIRQHMSVAADGKSILNGIDDLPLPAMLSDYLKFKDAE